MLRDDRRVPKQLQEKWARLEQRLAELGGAVVAFSGGTDSTFLLAVAKEVLGERVLAVTIASLVHPPWEEQEAAQLARDLGVPWRKVQLDLCQIPQFVSNPPDRCYHCKRHLGQELLKVAQAAGFPHVVDGSNQDDLGDYRPGMRAAKELGIISPLQEVGLTKGEIRTLSRHLGLPTWQKPAYACLASRIPYGIEVTPKRLEQLALAEDYLRRRGFEQLRVRYHQEVARIEVLPADFSRLVEIADDVVREFVNLGFTYVTMDLAGYRTGSLNVGLKQEIGAETG